MIIIDGDNKPGQVDLTPLAKYNPQNAGSRDVSQTSISIINGRTTTNVVKRYVMSYSLTTNKPGRIQLPSVTVSIDSKQYQTNPVVVNILKPGTTDQLGIEVKLSEQKCYVGQPIIMTVNLYISADIGDFKFNIPTFNSDAFYIEDPDMIEPDAKQYRLNSGVTVFVNQYRVVHNGKDSVLLSFSKVLIAKQAGQIEIETVSVSADVAVGLARSRDLFFDVFGTRKEYRRFMVNSQPQRLMVLPLPQENKPAEFYGLVGRYTISALATPTKVNVGDPITLTIKTGGSKYLKPVQWPELEKIDEFSSNFKIPSERASPTIEDGFKVFTQTIRANNDKVTQIPSIPLAFFEPNEARYVITRTEPIKLEVSPTKILTNADLEGRDFTPVSKEVKAIKKGLSANYERPDVLINQSFSPMAALISPGYAILWSVPLAGLVLSVFVKLFTHTTAEKEELRRRRQASRRAIRELKNLVSARLSSPKSANADEKSELLVSAMKQYIGERFDRAAGSLTADDCRQIIIDSTDDTQSAERYAEIISHCEAARYAPLTADVNAEQIKDVIELVRVIEKKSKK